MPSVCDSSRFIGSNNLQTENQLFAKCSVNDGVSGGGVDGDDHDDDDGCADDNKNNKTVIKITAKPPIYERLNPKTATKCLLDDREMPITREREGLRFEQNKGLWMRASTGSDSGLSPDRFSLRYDGR